MQLCEAATQLKPRCRSAQGFQLELLQAELGKMGYVVELKVVAPDEAFAAKQGPGHILENLHHQYLVCSGTKAENAEVMQLFILMQSHIHHWHAACSTMYAPVLPALDSLATLR